MSAKNNDLPKQPNEPKPKYLKVVSWNIRRGLVTRELELKNILRKEQIDIIFLTEADTRAISTESDYQIEGYTKLNTSDIYW